MAAKELRDRSEQIIRREAARLLTAPIESLRQQIDAEVKRNARGLDYFALLTPGGKRIIGNISRPEGLQINHSKDIDPRDGHGPMRMLAVRSSDGRIILIARDISERRYILDLLFRIVLVSCFSITPCVLLIGTSLSLRTLRWVGDLRLTSQQIVSGDLSVRMPISHRYDDFDIFATTVNGMIEELGRVVAQVKSVTDAVAHDLRTPLSHVKTALDDARTLPEMPNNLRIVMDGLIGELDIVLDRFSALLRIAELEASERRSGFGTVNLDILVDNLCELYVPLAEDMDVELSQQVEGGIRVSADKNLLFEALSNLVDNAIKFAERKVVVSVRCIAGAALVSVRDDGPGVPAEERQAVLRRFYRRAVDRDRPGTGLGLSVVAAILHVHRFGLELGDAQPGLIATITMPIADSQRGEQKFTNTSGAINGSSL